MEEAGKSKDITGQRFGRYTVLGPAGRRSGRIYWRCRCDCGNERLVEDWHLRSGHTKSCGCFRRDIPRSRRLDITGERYGRLVVLSPAEDPDTGVPDDTGVWWKCRCDCGNECVAHKERLRSGITRSCGCLQLEQRKENMKNAIHFVEGTCLERISSRKEGTNNTSGRRGVYRRENNKWRAMIGFKGKVYNLGTFSSFEDACAAREEAEEKFYVPFLEEQRNLQHSEL